MTRNLLTRTAAVALAAVVSVAAVSTGAEARYYRNYGGHYGHRSGGLAAGAVFGAVAGLALAGAAANSRGYYYDDPYYSGDSYVPAYYGGTVYREQRYYRPAAGYYGASDMVVYQQPRVRVYETYPAYRHGGDYYFKKWFETR